VGLNNKGGNMKTLELLEELGFGKAAEKVKKNIALKTKLAVAYEHYRFMSPEALERFQEALKMKTLGTKVVQDGFGRRREIEIYDQLRLTEISKSPKTPPMEVLLKVKEAKERGCFDYFQVADIETVEERPDPIIFGGIEGCDDLFFIAQWDNDVSIEDILKDGEG